MKKLNIWKRSFPVGEFTSDAIRSIRVAQLNVSGGFLIGIWLSIFLLLAHVHAELPCIGLTPPKRIDGHFTSGLAIAHSTRDRGLWEFQVTLKGNEKSGYSQMGSFFVPSDAGKSVLVGELELVWSEKNGVREGALAVRNKVKIAIRDSDRGRGHYEVWIDGVWKAIGEGFSLPEGDRTWRIRFVERK